MNVECAITISFQTDDLVRNETIDEGEWGTGHSKGGIDQPLTLVAIGTTEQSELLIVAHQSCLNGMGVILFHHIHHFRADIPKWGSFIRELMHRHVGSHRETAVMVLQDVIVAIE